MASEDNPSGAETPTDNYVTVTGSGSASFNAITFTKAGSYIFKISETNGNDSGYAYDESVWTLMVVVEDVDSVLTIKSHTYQKEGETSSEERALFTNNYSVKPTEYAPQIEKIVTGNAPSDVDFTFVVKAGQENPDGAVMPQDTTATVKGAGSASFKNITFSKPGIFTFEISEEMKIVSGYTYDESVWTLIVEVVDNESQLEVLSHSYTKSDGTVNDNMAVFENIYIPPTEPSDPISPTDPTTPTSPTKPTDPTNPTSSKKPKKTTPKGTSNNPPYGKKNSSNINNSNGGNNRNIPNTGSDSEKNLPVAFLVAFLLGLNTVYFAFRRKSLKGRKLK